MSHLPPVIIEYRGNPKQYVSVVLDAINLGRLTYDGVANCEQTFRALASVVDVISPKNGKTLSVETLVSYEKKKRAGEFEEKYAIRHLEIVNTLPNEVIMIEADGRRLWRVLENLYNNAFKYALEGTRVYVTIEDHGTDVVFTIKNVSANPLNISPDELTERFVRGDVSRTTEGSGLGLSIAKDLTTLQGGKFELIIDGDLFKAQITFPIKN